MIRVSAGIVRRNDGRILICQRGEGRSNAHLWEFPGGKEESGETPASCLRRELLEELHLPIQNIHTLCSQENSGILFTFLTAETDAEPILTEHEDFRWAEPRELLRYTFCPADTAVARSLALTHPPLQCYLWDLDGTLMDTYPGMVSAFCRAAEKLNIAVTPERVLALMKIRQGHCFQVISDESGLPYDTIRNAFRAEEAHLDPNLIQPFPGISETLQSLKSRGGRHFLVTHRDRDTAWKYLHNAGLAKFFEDGVFPEDGLAFKPAPDMILHLLQRHQLDAARCMMIGDRPLDIQCGQAAGVMTCLIDTDSRFTDCKSDLRTDSSRQLLELLSPA